MDHTRQLVLTQYPEKGMHVVYLMSRDQRVRDNHALLAAQQKAIDMGLPLVVVFRLRTNARERAYEHAAFMLAGLEELAQDLRELGIPFRLTTDSADYAYLDVLKQLQPAALYTDFSPLQGARGFIKKLAQQLQVQTYVVDTHNTVPVWVASQKQEFAAHTLRPKLHRLLESYLVEPGGVIAQSMPASLPASASFDEAYKLIETVYPKRGIRLEAQPGERAAAHRLGDFIDTQLETYALERNNSARDSQSRLSPYLHFGHISSLRVALEVLRATSKRPLLFDQAKMASPGEVPSREDGMNALFEELVVRKELADNFCLYATGYTKLEHAPQWAQNSLMAHADDPRDTLYTYEQLERAATHDPIWNAAQRELTLRGKIHGYMRMYWAKKLLEWTQSPHQALEVARLLNDRYSIDGGDPNGYVGILWSIAGLHDRPWVERPIFGMVRYMNDAGLRRKFAVDAYIARISE